LPQEKSGNPGDAQEEPHAKPAERGSGFIWNLSIKSGTVLGQGCQILLGTMYQHGEKYTKLPPIICTKWPFFVPGPDPCGDVWRGQRTSKMPLGSTFWKSTFCKSKLKRSTFGDIISGFHT
jgi:hypothetical protein